jgi:hypothetical protein
MVGVITTIPRFQFSGSTGIPLAAGLLYTYLTGTSTNAATWQNPALSVANANPVVLDGRGECVLWLDSTVTYRFVLKDSGGATQWVQDDISGAGSLADKLRTDLAASGGAALVGYLPGGTGAAASTVQAKLRECASVKDFGAIGDGVANDSGAIANALASGKPVFFPAGTYLTGAQTVATAGQTLFGEGAASVIKASTPTSHLFTVQADNVSFLSLRLHGAAVSNANTTFAIFTAAANPARYLAIQGLVISGADAAHGFNNAIKLDTGCHFASVFNTTIERLWGSISGTGYGVLCGQANGCRILANWLLASSGRGRHGVYLSAGSSDCVVQGNYVQGFDFEGITQYASGVQPACSGNIVSSNSVLTCAQSGNATSGAIGIYGHSSNARVCDNMVSASGAKGIAIDGTGVVDCADTVADGNTVVNSALIGIDVIAGVRGSVSNNKIRESGLASAGVSPNIRLVSDGTTATSGFLVSANHSSGPTWSRSAFQLNATAPAPSALTVTANKFDVCNLTAVELGGVVCAIDGRLRYSIALTPPSLAKGTSFSLGGLSIPGAELGDTLAWSYRGYAGNCDGCLMTVAITAAGLAEYVIANLSAATKTPTAGTLDIDVFKRAY